MKARYENDKVKGPGYGFFQISDMGENADLEGVRVGLKRSSDRKCLSRGGWQSAEQFLPVLGLSLTDDGVALAVGPEIVDWLDTVETFRLTLLFKNGTGAAAVLEVPEVIYSPQSGGAGLAEAAAAPPPAPEAVTPEPVQEQEPVQEAEPEPEPEAAEPQAPVPPLMPPLAPQEEKPKKGISPMLLLLAVLLLTAGAFAVWHFAQDRSEPVAESAKAKPEEAGAPSPLDQARKHLSGEADPAAGLSMARELRDAPEGADAAFLLAEDAAQKGLVEAMLLTASFYDPVDQGAHGTIAKDPEQALNWYRQVQSKGDEAQKAEAEKRISALRAFVEAGAAKGEAGAVELLKKF